MSVKNGNTEVQTSVPITSDRRCLLGQRHLVTFIGFITFFLISSHRVVLGVAIVAMVTHRQTNETLKWNRSNISCPLPTSFKSGSESNFQGDFDWSAELQGYILGIGFFSCLITQVPAGGLADAVGSKSLLVFSNILTGALAIISPAAARWHVYAFIAVQFLRGASQGITISANFKMTSNWIPRTERGTLNTLLVCGYSVGIAVTGIVTGWLCDISGFGWPSAFYFWGIVCVAMAILTHFVYFENPECNPWITDQELKLITEGMETKVCKKHPPTPWKSIFTSIPTYAYFYGLFGHLWGITYFMTVHPTFMGTVLHYSTAENGVASCLPVLLATVSGVCSSMMSHWISKERLMGLDKLRKFASGLSAFGFSLCMGGILLAGCDAIFNVLCFALSLFFLGIALAGVMISGIDMSPVFAGSVMGIAITVGGTANFLVPVITGLLTPHETLSEWQIVFWLNLVVVGSSGLVYILFGSAEVQPWNYPEGGHSTENEVKEEKINDKDAI